MIADPVDIAHLSAHCQPASEKLEADVCAEAEVHKSHCCRRRCRGAGGSDDRLARYAA